MRILFLTILIFCYIVGQTQDSYHNELINLLQSDYGLGTPSFILDDTEEEIVNSIYTYGNASRSTMQVSELDFQFISTYTVPGAGTNVWDAGTGIKNKTGIEKDDIVLVTFWAKRTSPNSEIFFFIEDGNTFEKEFYEEMNLTPDYNRYFIAVKASKNYSPDEMAIGFHLATLQQNFELAGFTALNYGGIDLEDVPSSFSTAAYGGFESDAPWRAAAAERIESLRKADLKVTVKSSNGALIENASVKIEMLEHEFGFGSAFVTCRFPGNDCYNSTYVERLQNLDGEGHGFNVGVTENALKWDGWEEEWIGSPDETASAIQYLSGQGIKMRGHTLFWPGYHLMPDDIVQNMNDLNYLRNRISARIDEMINHPVLSQHIEDWDVLNEITTNRDLESAFMSDPNFETGREIYQEIIEEVKMENSDIQLFINDYIVLSGGGSGSNVVDRYKFYLDELHESENGFDGIGFQCHIGSNPTSILKLESVWDEFYERYGKPLKVTEYDISDLVDPEIQAAYMRDILTITFSHPAMEAFIMWGFWDGNHWKGNAPMFDMQWNLKPSGQAFNDKVFKDWWTDEDGSTNTEGEAVFRGFKGKYLITSTVNGAEQSAELVLSDDQEVEFTFENATNVSDIEKSEYSFFPNLIADNYFELKLPPNVETANLSFYDNTGKLLWERTQHENNSKHIIDVIPGLYFVKASFGNYTVTERVIVH